MVDRMALDRLLGSALPHAVPWPKGLEPTPLTGTDATPVNASDDLSRYNGFDAVVVTWTSAEAEALAELFTPGYPISKWYKYQHNVDEYIELVTGEHAPFNDQSPDMARYYHTLGLYFPCRIGNANVLCFKSGLHLAYDGPKTPVYDLMYDLADTIGPKVFITTGTGGGIGKDIQLGDVVIASSVQFDCRQQFADMQWAKEQFNASTVLAEKLKVITPEMVSVNASRIPGGRSGAKFISGPDAKIVTTDFFAFDDSSNHYGLQGLGNICEMGDAMVAMALEALPLIDFYAIRNASDPQIANPDNDIREANKKAASIYAQYGGLTTAASVLACWAIIQGLK